MLKRGVAHARASVPLQIKRLFTSRDGGGDRKDDDDDDDCRGLVLLPGDLAWSASRRLSGGGAMASHRRQWRRWELIERRGPAL